MSVCLARYRVTFAGPRPLAFLLMMLACGPAMAQAKDRPNIVFILIDDLAYDAMGFTGAFPFLETPHIDRLARQGAAFENAFVTTSLCSPSRASFLTGRYAHRHGVWTNEGMGLDPAIPTFPQVLQEHGYATAWVGKWHLKRSAKPRPGFDYWLSFRGQGRYTDPKLNENDRDFQAKGYMTDLLTEYSVKWLKQEKDKPFLLCLSHKAVHGPFQPPPRYQDSLSGAKIPKPASWSDDFAGKPRWLRRVMKYGARRRAHNRSEGKPVPATLAPPQFDPSPKRRINYFEALRAVDDSVGRVVETLEAMDELDETLIVFTSDNGFFIMEHRRGDKRLAYEDSIRIPILVRYPKLVEAGTTIEPMALNIDVAPTLLKLAGAPVPEGMQGRSLLPLLRGERPKDWREAFLYEYFMEDWLAGFPTILAVRGENEKLIVTPNRAPDQIDELYDLKTDPHELNNLAADPDHAERVEAMRETLERLKKETGYRAPPER